MAALTIACPTELAGRPATAPVAAVEPAPSVAPLLALSSWSAKLVAVVEGAGVEGAGAAGVSICCSSATRARARSRDIRGLLRRAGPPALAPEADAPPARELR